MLFFGLIVVVDVCCFVTRLRCLLWLVVFVGCRLFLFVVVVMCCRRCVVSVGVVVCLLFLVVCLLRVSFVPLVFLYSLIVLSLFSLLMVVIDDCVVVVCCLVC